MYFSSKSIIFSVTFSTVNISPINIQANSPIKTIPAIITEVVLYFGFHFFYFWICTNFNKDKNSEYEKIEYMRQIHKNHLLKFTF